MVNLKIRSIGSRFRDFYSRRQCEWQFMSILQSQSFADQTSEDDEDQSFSTFVTVILRR